MSEYKLTLPAMGEGVMEATITNWIKNIGDTIEEDESVVEIATDKIDSDVPSPVTGKLKEILIPENGVVKVGQVMAILTVDVSTLSPDEIEILEEKTEEVNEVEPVYEEDITEIQDTAQETEAILELEERMVSATQVIQPTSYSGRFYSPLVKAIADKEGLSQSELDTVDGSGKEGRVTKEDILEFVEKKKTEKSNIVAIATTVDKPIEVKQEKVEITPQKTATETITTISGNDEAVDVDKPIEVKQEKIEITPQKTATETITAISGNDEIIEMDRVRKLIATHMVNSKQTSPHVTSFIEADMTPIVLWREKMKNEFYKKEGEKLTYMPILIHALVKTIKDFPMINISLDGNNIIKKKNINIGMATALPNGNLIVPVIKNADQYSLAGLAKKINDLAKRARENNLKPDEIVGGTYTITNVGSFGNTLATPIINQPQVAIMAVGAIIKKPAVIETPQGDLIGIRHKMYLSHAYDHRVIDGALGGMFVKRMAEYLEEFDTNTLV